MPLRQPAFEQAKYFFTWLYVYYSASERQAEKSRLSTPGSVAPETQLKNSVVSPGVSLAILSAGESEGKRRIPSNRARTIPGMPRHYMKDAQDFDKMPVHHFPSCGSPVARH